MDRAVSVGAASDLRASVQTGVVELTWARPSLGADEAKFAFRCKVLLRLAGRNYVGLDAAAQRESGTDEGWKQVAEGKELLQLTLDSLPPATRFEWRVQTLLIRGDGESSSVASFITGDAPPMSPPRDVRVTEVGLDYVILDWRPPALPNGNILNYVIYYDIFGEDSHTEHMVPSDKTSYRADHLFKQSCYRFQVAARTSIGEGPPSPIVFQETRASPLQAFLREGPASASSFSNPMKMTFVAGHAGHTVAPAYKQWLFPLLRLGSGGEAGPSAEASAKEEDAAPPSRTRGPGRGAMKDLLQKFRRQEACGTRDSASFRKSTPSNSTSSGACTAAARADNRAGNRAQRGDGEEDTDGPRLPLGNIPARAPCCGPWLERGWELIAGHIGLRAGSRYVVWVFRRPKPRSKEFRFAAEAACLQTRRTTSLVQRGLNAPTSIAARHAAVIELARIGGAVPPDIFMMLT